MSSHFELAEYNNNNNNKKKKKKKKKKKDVLMWKKKTKQIDTSHAIHFSPRCGLRTLTVC